MNKKGVARVVILAVVAVVGVIAMVISMSGGNNRDNSQFGITGMASLDGSKWEGAKISLECLCADTSTFADEIDAAGPKTSFTACGGSGVVHGSCSRTTDLIEKLPDSAVSCTATIDGCIFEQPCRMGVDDVCTDTSDTFQVIGFLKKNEQFVLDGRELTPASRFGNAFTFSCNVLDFPSDPTEVSADVWIRKTKGKGQEITENCGTVDIPPDIHPPVTLTAGENIGIQQTGEQDFTISSSGVCTVNDCVNGLFCFDILQSYRTESGGLQPVSGTQGLLGPPRDETCNFIDDDCDGVVDEGTWLLNGCGDGECFTDIALCVDGVQQPCEPLPKPEATETTCDDGKDNDCDGLIDGDDPDCGPPGECAGIICQDVCREQIGSCGWEYDSPGVCNTLYTVIGGVETACVWDGWCKTGDLCGGVTQCDGIECTAKGGACLQEVACPDTPEQCGEEYGLPPRCKFLDNEADCESSWSGYWSGIEAPYYCGWTGTACDEIAYC